MRRLFLLAVPLVMVRVLFPIFRVRGNSMSPGLSHGDLVLCIYCKRLRPGDVAVFSYGSRLLIKRVRRAEPGGYFMVGDNSRNSLDSRTFGLVPRDRVIARVLCRLSLKRQ